MFPKRKAKKKSSLVFFFFLCFALLCFLLLRKVGFPSIVPFPSKGCPAGLSLHVYRRARNKAYGLHYCVSVPYPTLPCPSLKGSISRVRTPRKVRPAHAALQSERASEQFPCRGPGGGVCGRGREGHMQTSDKRFSFFFYPLVPLPIWISSGARLRTEIGNFSDGLVSTTLQHVGEGICV